MNKRKVINSFIALLIIISSVSFYIYMKKTNPNLKSKSKSEITEKSWTIKAFTVKKQSLSPMIKLYGRVESVVNSTVSSIISADVTSVVALEGQKVKKGDVLITLNTQDITLLLKQRQAELNGVKSNLTSSKKELKRQERLYRKGIISASSIEKSRQIVRKQTSDYNKVSALLQSVKNDRGRATVVAPFSGRITAIYVSSGDRVNRGSRLLSMYDSESLEVRVQLPNNSLATLRDLWDNGIEVNATIGNYATTAVLSRITGEVKPNSAGVEALFRLQSEDKSLSLGKTVTAIISLPKQDGAIYLPYEAIYDLNKVYLIEDGRLKKIKVTILGQYSLPNDTKKYQLISSPDLLDNSQVLISHLPSAMTGLKVSVVNLDGININQNDSDLSGAK